MTRDEAKALGLTEYVPDKPCRRGHWHRNTKGGYCIPCYKESVKKYNAKPEVKKYHAEKQKKRRAEQGDKYREYINAYMREYNKTEKGKAYRAELKRRNKQKKNLGSTKE